MTEEVINSKVVIIDRNGNPHCMGEVSSFDLHNDYLLEYIDYYYPDEKEFEGVDENTFNRMTIFHLLNVGDVVYLNNGHIGNIFVPDNMTEAQIKTVYGLALYLGDQPVLFNYNPVDFTDFGFVNYQEIGINEDKNLKEDMDKYLGEVEIKNSPSKNK